MKKYFVFLFLCILFLCGCKNKTVMIAFNSNGGSYIMPEIIESGKSIEITSPTKEGFNFDGWYYDDALTIPYNNETFKRNTTLYAKWTPKTYTIAFDYDIEPIEAEFLSEINLPTPTKEGFVFDGWYTSPYLDKPFTAQYMPLGGAYLYPKWTPKTFQVKFYHFGGLLDIQTINYNERITPPIVPSREGYIFTGWDHDLETIKSDAIISAMYIPKVFIVDFETNGGTSIDSIAVTYGESVSMPAPPQKPLKVFDGWYLDADFKELYQNTQVTNNITLYAKWKDAFTYVLKYDDTYEIYKYNGSDEIIEIPSEFQSKKVTSIGENAFINSTNLKKVIINNNIKTINSYAFYDCINLEEVYIGDNVIQIEEGALSSCSKLKKLTIPFVGKSKDATDSESHFAFIFGKKEFYNAYNVILPLNDPLCRSYFLPNTLEEVTITSGKKIKDYSFYNCKSIKKVILPDSIDTIESFAFYKCSGLEEIKFPKDLEVIEEYSFYDCINIKNIEINNNLKEIKSYAFKGCISLKNVYINKESKLNLLGEGVFLGCISLEEIFLPNSIEILPNNLFAYCSNLKNVNLPLGIKEISKYCFYNCISLRFFISSPLIEKLDDYSFGNCINLDCVYISISLMYLGENVFDGCMRLEAIHYEGTIDDWENITKESNQFLEDVNIIDSFLLK